MKLARNWPIAVAMLLIGFSSKPVLAISPWAVMVYGEKLEQPILLRPASPADFPAFGLLWWKAGSYAHPNRTVQGDPQLLSDLRHRPYVNLAIFNRIPFLKNLRGLPRSGLWVHRNSPRSKAWDSLVSRPSPR
jgi:hypothetical protein